MGDRLSDERVAVLASWATVGGDGWTSIAGRLAREVQERRDADACALCGVRRDEHDEFSGAHPFKRFVAPSLRAAAGAVPEVRDEGDEG